jgi:alginate O-acetyltransferase complex protein AlgI
MIFNDFLFLFVFLPIVVFGFFRVAPNTLRVWVLLAASLTFYAISGVEHVLILILGVLWTYAIAATPKIEGSKWLLTLAILGPASALFYYKYFGFFAQSLDLEIIDSDGFSLFDSVVLPAGISFFTFQLVAFAIDRYRGHIDTPPSFAKFALYISFFPQLVAGPILRFQQVAESLDGLTSFQLTRQTAMTAIAYIVLGLGAKVLIADSLGNYINPWLGQPEALGSVGAVYVLLAYSFQIYFDFYGYSLVAIGLGRLFGFNFPDNFLRPYESQNIKEFWRRWHVTLSFWIRDYLYVPLGGNKRYALNIVIIFAACGLWHGAGWPFVIWGLYHGALVALYGATSRIWDAMPKLAQIALTFSLVSLGWTLFIFDFKGVVLFFDSLLGAGSAELPAPAAEQWTLLAIATIVCFVPKFERLASKAGAQGTWVGSIGYAAFFSLILLFVNRSNDFIYFRF